MALNLVEKLINTGGVLKLVYVDVDGPASYLADGQTVNASDLGYRHIYFATAGGSDNGDQFCAVGHSAHGALASVKVAWFVNTTGAEVANGVDLSGRFVRVAFWVN